MKKFLTFMLLTISMFSFFILYNQQKELQIFNMKNAEHHLQNSYQITIPSKINSLPRGTQYKEILETSDSNDASIFFSRIENIDGQEKIIKYIYTANDDYMDKFQLVWGKKLDKTLMDTHYFLSTEDTGDKNQIGRIAAFNGIHMEIRTLQDMLDSGLFLDGPCTVTLPDKDKVNSMSDKFLEWLDVKGIDVTESYDIGDVNPSSKSYFQISVLFFVIILLILYDILRSYKKIAVEKLLGFSTFQIWKKRISKIILVQILTMFISAIIMSLVLFKDFNILYLSFLRDLAVMYGILLVIVIVVASLPFLFIENIQISAAIKNKQPVKEIIFFNTVIKIFLCLCLIFLVNSQIANYADIKKAFDGSYKTWEKASSYKVMNLTNSFITDSKRNIPIYNYFNQRGAIFAGFQMYTKQSMDANKNVPITDFNALVNPNYLKENPIYDLNGKKIIISERDSNWVLLVPEKYKKDEIGIRSFHQKWMDSFGNKSKSKRKIEIIWTRNNQKAFSYDFNVYPENGFYVTDPILLVGTEDGGAYPGWNTQIFNIAGNPFKVKIPEGENAGDFIEEGLNKFGYLSYGLQINNADEEVASHISEYKTMFMWLITGLILVLLVIAVVITQNVYNFFEQFKIRLAVRKLHGYKKLSKYREYLILLAISWLIIIILSFVISSFRAFARTEVILAVSILGFIIEAIISVILLNFVENKKIIEVIKGGN